MTNFQRGITRWLAAGSGLLLTQAVWGFSVKPGASIVRVVPGKTTVARFDVVNDSTATLRFSTRLRDSFVLPENKAFPAASWLKITTPEFAVPAQSTKTVTLQVQAPVAAKGELAAFVSFIPAVEESTGPVTGAQTRIVTMITVSLYARLKGTETGKADLGDVRVSNAAAKGTVPEEVEVSVLVKNLGNVHQRPSGKLDIFPKSGSKPVRTLEFASGLPVMPQSEALYTARAPGKLLPGDYVVRAHVQFGPQSTIDKSVAFTVLPAGATTGYLDLPSR
jgi:hypothetical protein